MQVPITLRASSRNVELGCQSVLSDAQPLADLTEHASLKVLPLVTVLLLLRGGVHLFQWVLFNLSIGWVDNRKTDVCSSMLKHSLNVCTCVLRLLETKPLFNTLLMYYPSYLI